MSSEQEAQIGKVVSPHGVGGLVKVFPYSDFPERVKLLKRVTLLQDGTRTGKLVRQASLYGRFWLVKFEGVDSREQAEFLAGSVLLIPIEDRLPLPADTYYHDQLTGLRVVSPGGGNIGIVVDIVTTGGHDLLVVERPGENIKNILVPAVRKFVLEVDLRSGHLVAELPPGLLDL